MEVWKPVIGFKEVEGEYEVSNKGNVRSLDRWKTNSIGSKYFYKGRVLSTHYNHKGYKRVQLGKQGAQTVHQIVAKAFIPKPEGKEQVNHKDGNKDNNCADNLEWVSMKENLNHAWENNLRSVQSFHSYNDTRSKKVAKYTLDGEFIAEYKSINEAARQSNDYASNIRAVCLGNRIKSRGFKYKYI
jgi:hypothetical protein